MRAQRICKLLSLSLLAACFFHSQVNAAPSKHKEEANPDTELIDTPTAEVLDYYGLLVRTRFMSDGGVLTGVGFGVLNRLNLGASATVDKMIGTDEPMR
ncbi:MAG TPA: hypothetical protein PLL10_11150, partial [Elusimicrobiales bacterium]|nr:hypothetical protein [Elusimicrobiales bacterium]